MGLPQSVLVVDDEAHIRAVLERVLTNLGIAHVQVAENGAEACALYGQTRCDVVIMDINMPAMTGIEALVRIREKDPDVRAIMLTSLGSRRAVEQSAEIGALSFLRKNLPLAELKSRLENALLEAME